ncbi:MAG: SirB2 family protein [Rubrivivax sp.]|nr:SirB2 family protein [Rubrivivax sp.]
MSLIATHYLLLKHTHIALAALSVSLFAARVLGVLVGARWPHRRVLRVASVAIDTLLVAAGGTLWWLLALDAQRDRWLLIKLVLVVAYIGAGSVAMKRARTRAGKAAAFGVALLLVGGVLALALTRDAGVLLRWAG